MSGKILHRYWYRIKEHMWDQEESCKIIYDPNLLFWLLAYVQNKASEFRSEVRARCILNPTLLTPNFPKYINGLKMPTQEGKELILV